MNSSDNSSIPVVPQQEISLNMTVRWTITVSLFLSLSPSYLSLPSPLHIPSSSGNKKKRNERRTRLGPWSIPSRKILGVRDFFPSLARLCYVALRLAASGISLHLSLFFVTVIRRIVFKFVSSHMPLFVDSSMFLSLTFALFPKFSLLLSLFFTTSPLLSFSLCRDVRVRGRCRPCE